MSRIITALFSLAAAAIGLYRDSLRPDPAPPVVNIILTPGIESHPAPEPANSPLDTSIVIPIPDRSPVNGAQPVEIPQSSRAMLQNILRHQ